MPKIAIQGAKSPSAASLTPSGTTRPPSFSGVTALGWIIWEDVLEDRAEDDQDTDDLYPARSRAGAAPDEHEQDEGYLGRSVPLVEVRHHVPARRDDARY